MRRQLLFSCAEIREKWLSAKSSYCEKTVRNMGFLKNWLTSGESTIIIHKIQNKKHEFII